MSEVWRLRRLEVVEVAVEDVEAVVAHLRFADPEVILGVKACSTHCSCVLC